MATLLKPWIITYRDAAGKRVPKGTPGAKKHRRKSSKWYGQGIPGLPPKKRVPLASDKAAARRMLDDMVRDAERGTLRMPTANAAKTPLADYLTTFEADLRRGLATRNRRRKPSPEQVRLTVHRVRACLDGCGFTMPADLNDSAAGKLDDYLCGRSGVSRKDGGMSAQSAAFYLAAMKRFVWWLSVRQRLPVRQELLDAVRVEDPNANRIHARRPATPSEVEKLLATVKASKRTYRGLTGIDRYHLWTLAISTGLRANELATVTPGHFAMDAEPPVVTLGANETKNSKAARQPLPLPVASMFREYLQGRPADKPVWPGTWPGKTAIMLRRDLAEAGIPYMLETPDGPKFLDAHSIRHTYVTSLAAAGVGVKELQTLARHAHASTTLNVYTHATAPAITESVAKINVPGVTGQDSTLSSMPRSQLEAIAAIALILANHAYGLFAPPFVPESRTMLD